MLHFLSILIPLLSLGILAALAIIDLKTRLLPNVLVLSFAILGFLFHSVTLFSYTTPLDLGLGTLIGGGLLYSIRIIGNFFYKQDTLGLGDVKLMAAAGLWLGPYDVLIALTCGALAGLIQGGISLSYNALRKAKNGPLSTYSIPAGPGFITGILIAALAKFWPLSHLLS